MTASPELRADCSRCFALCCVATSFARSADFAFDKAAGEPCRHLADDFGCSVHDRLRDLGMPGCTTYDCFGAGQQLSQVTYAGRDWRTHPGTAPQMFGALAAMRALHEMLWYLTEPPGSSRRPWPPTWPPRTTRRWPSPGSAPTTWRRWTWTRTGTGSPRCCAGSSGLVRGDGPDRRGADLAGARLRGADLRRCDLRGALLVGADLRDADLSLADLIGADLRGADVARGRPVHGAVPDPVPGERRPGRRRDPAAGVAGPAGALDGRLMPEGDTVWRTALHLDRALSGETLLETDFRVPAHATLDLSGRTVEATVARGKHLLTRIGADHTLHTHLKMEGSWHLYKPGTAWRRPAHEARVVLRTAEWTAVGFALASSRWSPATPRTPSSATSAPTCSARTGTRTRRCAGCAPTRRARWPTRSSTSATWPGSATSTRTSCASWPARTRGCRSPRSPTCPGWCAGPAPRWRRTRTASSRPSPATPGRGQQTWVYRRDKQPCRRCGTRIRVDMQGPETQERATYWCPACQPDPLR